MQLETEFGEKWQAGQVAGWEDRGQGGQGAGAAAADGSSGALDLDAFDSADELEMLGEALLCSAGEDESMIWHVG